MTQVTIQMKVYDRDGRRVYMEEVRLPHDMEAEDAQKWVTDSCRLLKQNPKKAIPKVEAARSELV